MQVKTWLAIRISERIDLKPKTVKREKEGYYIMKKDQPIKEI